MTDAPFEIRTDLAIQHFAAEVSAQRVILTHVLTDLAEQSALVRASLETLLGSVRPRNQADREAANADELAEITASLALGRILTDISDSLEAPLLPRASLRPL